MKYSLQIQKPKAKILSTISEFTELVLEQRFEFKVQIAFLITSLSLLSEIFLCQYKRVSSFFFILNIVLGPAHTSFEYSSFVCNNVYNIILHGYFLKLF